MTQTISGLFDDYGSARAAVSELEGSGIRHSDISIVAHNAGGAQGASGETVNDAGRGTTGVAGEAVSEAGRGAEVGTAIGGIGGLLAGLGMLAIPGVGPVVAAGWLVATVTGAGVGAVVGGAAGGLISSLTQAGVSERDAHVYAEGVRRGGTLVTARVADEQASAAQAILTTNRAVDPAARGDSYRTSGWSNFDDAAQPYTPEQIAQERARNQNLR